MKKMSRLLALSFFLALMSLVMLGRPGQAADADEGQYYVFNQDGSLSTGGWVKSVDVYGDVSWYYANPDGTAFTGWKKISGEWYYFDPDSYYYGEMVTGSEEIDGKWYVFDQSGALSTGGWVKDSYGNWYYTNADGTPVTGWKTVEGKRYYFDFGPGVHHGEMVTGSKQIDGTVFVFDQSGALSTGGWVRNPDYPVDHWYYANADGTAVTGWKTIGGKRYYFVDSDDSDYYGTMATGIVWIE